MCFQYTANLAQRMHNSIQLPYSAHRGATDMKGATSRSYHPTSPRNNMAFTRKTKRIVVGCGLAAVVSTGALLSSGATAFFTANAVIGNNTFTAGSLDIALTPEGPAATAISYANMVPGDSVTQPVVVQNVGSVDFRYSMTSAATNPDGRALKDQLVFTIKTSDAGGGCSAFTGTTIYAGDLDSSIGKIIGDPATGAQPGDRALNSPLTETLCFRGTLPTTAGNLYQSATTTATFTFDAEQVANNP
jgi:Camelysin metallo-endopeptidase